MTDLSIDLPSDAAVAIVRRALLASRETNPEICIRCGEPRCGSVLAWAGRTDHGTLFTSWWEAGLREPRASMKAREQERVSGERTVEYHGVATVLELVESPALLVRCPKHGSAVLETSEVQRAVRTNTDMIVPLHLPHIRYGSPRTCQLEDLGAGVEIVHHRFRYGRPVLSTEELEFRLREMNPARSPST